jgi:hypothetical protein
MKTNNFFALAALTCGFALSFTACSNEDNSVINKQTYTISFEKQQLNADGFWCGDETGTPFDNYGSTAYTCIYKEAGTSFTANFTPAWGSWSGFAISNRTATTFSAETLTPDQFNNITGTAKSGKNFMVVYPYYESIEFNGPVTLKGFWYTNSAYTVDAILNGDGMSPGKFEANDFLTCVIYPENANGLEGGARYELPLAKNGDYVKDWQYCDLSDFVAFKNIKSISFGFEGSKRNDWGLTTPTYICIDDIVIER